MTDYRLNVPFNCSHIIHVPVHVVFSGHLHWSSASEAVLLVTIRCGHCSHAWLPISVLYVFIAHSVTEYTISTQSFFAYMTPVDSTTAELLQNRLVDMSLANELRQV